MPDANVELPPIPDVLPVFPLRDSVVYPDVAAPLLVSQPRLVELVSYALRQTKLAAFVAQRNPDALPAAPADLYPLGALGVLHELGRTESTIRLAVQGVARLRTLDFVQQQPYLVARIEIARELPENPVELEALVRTAKELFGRFLQLSPELSTELLAAADKMPPRQLAYLIASTIPLSLAARQEILEFDAVSSRLRRLSVALQHELAVRELIQRITSETAEEISRSQREHILRKHMESIQRELGDHGRSEIGELRETVAKTLLSEEAHKEVTREIDRLEGTPEVSPERGMIRTYVDWVLKMPWGKLTGERIDVSRAREVLDEDHYDVEKIKDRIVDHLAVLHLRAERRSDGDHAAKEPRTEPILCFLGPPGVGKTSLGQSIARALGRPFVRQSLGGVHDEAEIRGHRRTYIGAMPGRIMQALARAGAADPVFMLDEVDKLGAGFHGDPSAALLELLDPAQNKAFVDTYLGVSFDVSRVLFICTANSSDTIPAPLLDRMEVLTLAGYTDLEKLHIATRFLVPNQRAANGLREGEVVMSDDVLIALVRGYTREAGVRNLEREIGTVLRKAARRILEKAPTPIHIARSDLRAYLGPPRFTDEVAERIDRPGVAAGLAWTPTGGELLFVEATMVPGSEERLILTGMLGNVMRESAEAALTYLRASTGPLSIDPRYLQERRVVHVHVPAGGIPKDGPSAGITMLVALASSALERPVRAGVAMTGEITLRGKVLPVGGIKEKVLAAYRAGLGTILLPRRNELDLEDVPREVRAACRFVLVESVDDVLRESLGVPAPAPPPAVYDDQEEAARSAPRSMH